mgnify:CR=1 FL=1
MVPTKVMSSTPLGEYVFQSPGSHMRARVVTMMTKRSNHMPMLTKIEMTNSTVGFRRRLRNQKNCGLITLHDTMIQ